MGSIVEQVMRAAKEQGFEYIGQVACSQLHVRPEVRDMCASDRCQHYGKSWSCPPACGSIEQFQAEIERRNLAIVMQTVGQLEDSFDFESMVEFSQVHNDRFHRLVDYLREADFVQGLDPAPFFLGAGTCGICPTCSYPDAPCRFPERSYASLEAAGFVVADVCKAASLEYNHGNNTVCYSACVFVSE